MRRAPLLRSAAFRLGVLQATLFALIAVVLFAVTWWAVHGYVERQLRGNIREEVHEVGSVPSARLALVVQRLTRRSPNGPYFYAYVDARGRQLAGALPATHAALGWHRRSIHSQRGHDDDQRVDVLVYGHQLKQGGFLLVGLDRHQEDELDDLLQNAFLGAGAAAVLLALLGGWLAARRYLSRVEAVADSAARIVAGDLDARIAGSGRDDEFDRLAAALNTMLARIQQLMESMRQVSNDVAHDLRTPLSHLRQRLEQAVRDADSVEDFRTVTEHAVADVDKVLDTFAALLRIAQIETRQLRAGFSRVDLSEQVDALVQDYAPVFEDQDHPLHAHIASGLVCLGDPALLTQMLANLLENALRHTPAGTPVMLELSQVDGVPEICIRDAGPGIPVDQHQRVFNRFTRLDAARSTPGSGLGMALVAAIAERHGIVIALHDAAPGLEIHLRFPPGLSD